MCIALKEVIQPLGLSDSNMHLLSSVQLQNVGVYGSTTQGTQINLMPSYIWPEISK